MPLKFVYISKGIFNASYDAAPYGARLPGQTTFIWKERMTEKMNPKRRHNNI